MKVISLTQGSEAWLEWRKTGIGASEVAAICGIDPYKTALDVYNDKKGLSKPRRNSAMQRGIDYEDEARRVFNRVREHPFEPMLFEHEEYDWMKASLDGYCSFTRMLLEVKIPKRDVLDMARYGQVPIHYLYQMQWQLYVSGAVKGYFFAYNPDTLESYVVEVYPDDELLYKILQVVTEFYFTNILGNIPPKDKSDRKMVCDAGKDKLMRMGEIKERMKELEAEYDGLVKDLHDLEGKDISLECDKWVLLKGERTSVDYKQAAVDAAVDLTLYTKPKTIFWTIKAK